MTLLRLQIDNLALIDHAELELGPGLNVFTGETGAGKTMLAQAIGLLAGAAPAAGMVGPHGAETYVEAEFAVPDGFFERRAPEAVAALRPEGETTLVVARRIAASGRSRALVWGRSCARDDLEQLGELLLEVSSQHEARRLARPATQLDLLDSAARQRQAALGHGRAPGASCARPASSWRRPGRPPPTPSAGAASSRSWSARVGEAAIDPGEPVALAQERERLRHLDELVAAIAGAAGAGQPRGGRRRAQPGRSRGRAARPTPSATSRSWERWRPSCATRRLRMQEAAIELRAQLDGLEPEPGRLEHVEARLLLFSELEHRFGDARRRPAGALRGGAGGARPDRHRRTPAGRAGGRPGRGDEPRRSARPLACARPAARPRKPFSQAVETELADLGMDGARLEVQIEPAELGVRGADRVTLLLAANAGLPAGPASRALPREASCRGSRWRCGWWRGPRAAQPRCCWTRSTPAWAGARRTRWPRS